MTQGSSSVGAPSGNALRPISYPMSNGEPGAVYSLLLPSDVVRSIERRSSPRVR
jgi:hypothetical protein